MVLFLSINNDFSVFFLPVDGVRLRVLTTLRWDSSYFIGLRASRIPRGRARVEGDAPSGIPRVMRGSRSTGPIRGSTPYQLGCIIYLVSSQVIPVRPATIVHLRMPGINARHRFDVRNDRCAVARRAPCLILAYCCLPDKTQTEPLAEVGPTLSKSPLRGPFTPLDCR